MGRNKYGNVFRIVTTQKKEIVMKCPKCDQEHDLKQPCPPKKKGPKSSSKHQMPKQNRDGNWLSMGEIK
ncbi:MAG TPA: hypothetical protein VFI61_03815 [Patescibacteria group bacterium]|nr:hypothetical protein [Patescibacteria group bacterium]